MLRDLPILTDDEIRRGAAAGDEAGLGTLRTALGNLPLAAVDIRARVDGLVAWTTVRQTFVNATDEPLEATYIFPLCDRAAVTGFRMEVAGRVLEGILRERGAARREYDEAVREGRRAALAEEERPGVFTLRVGNLMPGERATVRLRLCGPLAYDDGEATYRFPLVVAPRYIPGKPLPGASVGDGVAPDTDAVPDASRITPPVLLPGFPNPVRLSLEVELRDAGLGVHDLRSSLHGVTVAEEPGRLRVTLRPGERLDRDFLLRFRTATGAVRTSLQLHPDAEGAEGTFALTLVPPAGTAGQARPRDVVFVLDRSGSMGGWKMTAARRAVARMADTLTERDRFTVFAFDDRLEAPPAFAGEALVPATDRNRFRATEFLARLEGRGGTELAQPLRRAVEVLAAGPEAEGRDRILVLVTDGQVGNEDQILHELRGRVQAVRVFTLGIDQAVNAGFLRRLAVLGGGAFELVESEDRLDAVMQKIHRRLGEPVLADVRPEPAGLELEPDTLLPARPADLFPGAPLFLLGRYRGRAAGALVLQGRDAAGRPWREQVAAQVTDNPALAAMWARARVRELEDRYVTAGGDRSRLEKDLVETSLRFGVLCRFTAYVAADVKEVVNPGGTVHRVVQPVELPAGWEMPVPPAPMAALRCFAAAAPPPAGACDGESVDSFLMEFEAEPGNAPPPRASAPQPAKRRQGVVNRLRKLFGESEGSAAGPAAAGAGSAGTTELSSYRRRAGELLEQLRRHASADAATRLNEVGLLAVRLAALVEDLQSVGAPANELRPLQDLLDDLRRLPAEAAADLDRSWVRAEKVLREFSAPDSTVRSTEFWK